VFFVPSVAQAVGVLSFAFFVAFVALLAVLFAATKQPRKREENLLFLVRYSLFAV